MLVATITAIIHGGALPAFALVFGDFVDLFLNQGRTEAVGAQITFLLNETIALNGSESGLLNLPELDCENPDPFNASAIMEFLPLLVNVTFEIAGRPDPVVFPVEITEMSTWTTIFESINLECLDNEAFIQGINTFVYVFLGIAMGVFTFAYFEISLFQTACERQVKKIRFAFYRAIMRQEVGWFDANPSGGLASRIAE